MLNSAKFMIENERKGEMLKKQPLIALLISVLLAVQIILFGFNIHLDIAYAQEEPAIIYVDPATVSWLEPGQEFTVDIKIENVTNLYGFDIKFSWNPEILEHVSHEAKIPVETYPEGILHSPVQPVKDEINATKGLYNVAYSSMSPAEPFNGSGTIFTITFRVLDYGVSPLAFTSIKLAGYGLPPPPIPYQAYDGRFINFVPPPAKLFTDPHKIIDPTLIPCKNFTIEINIEDVYYLSEFEFWLNYNTSVLDTLAVEVESPFTSPLTQIFEEEGKIRVGASADSLSGNFTLASITFHVSDSGESVLDLYNVSLTDDMGELIQYEEPVDGYFNNILMAKLFIYPPELIDPTMAPGSNFTIAIKMQDAIDFYGYEFRLDYDPNVIMCIGAIILPPNNDTNYNTMIEADSFLGTLRVNVSYYLPAEPITILDPKTVVLLYFQVKSYGSTTLDLYSINIVDNEGRSIPRLEDGSEDGYFATLTADVAILAMEISKNAVYSGKTVNITVVAGNVGDLTATFNVTAYYDTTPIETQTVTDLLPEQNVTLTFIWDTTGLEPCNNFTVSAEASQVPYEVNIANNVLIGGYVKIKMLGDVNGDGIIDIYDVVAATLAYGSEEGDPNWNEDVDLAPPLGIIDIFDIVTITANYGKTC